MDWVPLHVHSQYSILDAAASVKDIAEKAAAYAMPAVALTDHGNLFGAVDFFKTCKGVNVKPLIGCEVYVAPSSRFEKAKSSFGKTAHHLVLIAKDLEGYHNLCKLSSIGYLEGFYYHPRIDKQVLKQFSKGIICLSACLSSSVAEKALHSSHEELIQEISWFSDLFKEDYYLEIQRHRMSDENILIDGLGEETWLYQNYVDFIEKQEKVNTLLIEASKKLGIPLVATNDSHYIDRADWKAHEILLNIASGETCEIWERDSLGNAKRCVPNPKRRVYPSHEVYFKSQEEMGELFHDVPEALSNTLLVANKCNVELDFKTKHYPIYIPPDFHDGFTKEEQAKSVALYLKSLCEEGIVKRYDIKKLEKVAEQYPEKDPLQVVRDRLAYELDLIISKGMSDYLLIVYDFINWAKLKGIPMGPGRGSGAGSIVCYLVGITDIEPLRFNLFFERFINPERISYPDIDVDICMDRRSEVIDYTLQKYGKDNIAQIITFGTMKAKMAIRDIGRVLNIPLSKVNEIAKLVPEDPNMTLEKALDTDPDLYRLSQEDSDAKRIISLAKKLEGSIRNTGIHAAGIIISGDPLTNHIPLCNAKDSSIAATQYSMKPVELVGMLKIDFLGLKTLTCIQKAVDSIAKYKGVKIDWVNLPLDDKGTFSLLNQGKTLGIFQMESGGMQELARNLHLDKFEEIIAVLSLYRPGPMDMIPSFINRKHGKEEIESDHPWMEEILRETYGIMVYQEQVMQIAQKLANYSLGEGDVLRRAMGKKDMAEMGKQREKFVQGCFKNNIDTETAMRIFDKMEKFAAYGFNKSHAAAYGYLTYVTAYLKAHYPEEWMAALMTCDRDDVTKIAKFIRECQSLSIDILPPDVNEAEIEFVAAASGIRFAMTGIKGIGSAVVDAIIQERAQKGVYTNFYNFFKRIDMKRVGKKAIESLVEAGAFDFTRWQREALKESIEPMYESALKEQKDAKKGVMTFFSLLGDTEEQHFLAEPAIRQKLSKLQVLTREKELLGFFLTGHPMDTYKDILRRLACVSLSEIENMPHDTVFRSAFILESVQIRTAQKTQRKFAITEISDGIDRFEMPIWSDLYEEKAHLLKENQLLYAVLQVDKRESASKISCRWFDDLTSVKEETILACDLAYDKAKAYITKGFASKSKPQSVSSKEKNEPSKLVKPMKVVINIDMIRLSHILQIKELFRSSAGSMSVHIDFQRDHKVVGALFIDSSWGITVNDQLIKQLEQVSAVVRVESH
ncbi:MAG: DNA polymerase III subunit alpha [Chlamydiales bacterium]|nr:DNA polymerase III subunit alpha [Chlamydiales bacterium]